MGAGGLKFESSESFTFDPVTRRSRRMIGSQSQMLELFGEDLEQIMWKEIRTMACEMGDSPKHWKFIPSTAMIQGICDKVQACMREVFGPTHNATSSHAT